MKAKIFTVFLLLQLLINCTFASDYPKSRLEKEMDEMGSVTGNEGIVFRPGKVRSTATKASVSKVGKVNKYLYKAALEILDNALLASSDSTGGVIVTEWYSNGSSSNTQYKVNVFIKDDVISAEAIEVKAFERARRNGKWSEDYKKSPIALVLEDKILRRARELYIAAGRK